MSKEHRGGRNTSGLKSAGEIAAAGVVAGLVGVAGITVRHHRELTHRSVDLPPFVQKFIDLEQRSLGVGEPTIWAAVHRIHHQFTDASANSFRQIANVIKAIENPDNSDTIGKVSIPDEFEHLDPFVKKFSRDEVMEIGGLAEEFIKERLGDAYTSQTNYSVEDAQKILNPQKPTYYYPEYKKHKGEWTQEDIAQILLTDPHSPALINRKNEVRGVTMHNYGLYKQSADLFRDEPSLKQEDLQNEDGKNKKSRKRDIVAGGAVASAVALFARGKFEPKDIVKAIGAGSVITAVRGLTEVAGGGVVNSLGHAGVLDSSRITRAIFNREYDIKINEDGTLATDTVKAGLVGKVLSWATFDEVGRQAFHHAKPEKIAYTDRKGLAGVADAPWGSFTSFLAESKLPLISPGKGFELKDGERRPDMPHRATELIQEARVRELSVKKSSDTSRIFG